MRLMSVGTWVVAGGKVLRFEMIYRTLHNAVPPESTIISEGGTGLRKDSQQHVEKIPDSFLHKSAQ
jgi:hypothetical protein